jgi:S-DNA-T family DNA segregation ATPase FtsK/SpoIIIE
MRKQSEGHTASNPKIDWPPFLIKRVSEGGFILILALAFFVLLSLETYQTADPGWFHGGHAMAIANAGGRVGAFLADTLYWLLGYVAYALPIAVAYLAWIILHDHRALHRVNKPMLTLRAVGLLLLLVGGSGLFMLLVRGNAFVSYGSGGILGRVVVTHLCAMVNLQGTLLLLSTVFLVGVTWLTGFSWIQETERLGRCTLFLLQGVFRLAHAGGMHTMRIVRRLQIHWTPKAPVLIQAERSLVRVKKEKQAPLLGVVMEKMRPARVINETPATIATVPMMIEGLPPLTLLDKGLPGKPMGGYTPEELEVLSRDLEQHLLDFGIQVDVVAVHPGPVITRFELQLAAGVKASRLTALAKDLARSLSVLSVRVVEIIPGKTVVGLELPNPYRATVALSDVFSADVYQQAHSPLTLALGVDIAGHPMVVDLAKMPHLLVAGTTGSGKSVGINAMILSLLFRATPEQVRLIMVDPKMLELSIYDGIPHLLTPVVTDMKEAASALRWCVEEMERRYRLMAALGVRHMVGFNTKVTESIAKGEPLCDPLWKPVNGLSDSAPLLTTLPYVVVIIDELADMMMVVGKKVEQLIARIAQKARASGIHLILATQRPSVDVLTGLIKSNIPTRISFQVSSKIDSRTILDQQGAEQLLGYGDMLFLAPGSGAPLRVHGAFVDDQEVHRVANDWRSRGVPQYIDEITQSREEMNDGGGMSDATEDSDPLYDEAVAFVLQTRKASTSAVQRRFKIGYNRAARLVDEMERTGVVGPLDGGFRDVLVNASSED